MNNYVKMFFCFVGVWIFAWLAGSFACAEFDISKWGDSARSLTATFASFFCVMLLPAIFSK